MKTYTREDHMNFYGFGLSKNYSYKYSHPWEYKNPNFLCGCRRLFGKNNLIVNSFYFKDCERCFGRGKEPIPWSELE